MVKSTKVHYAAERVAILREYLELGMAIRDHIYKDDPEARDYEAPSLTWIAAAVSLGHSEGKPFTQTGLAEYLKFDRATIKRRCDTLINRGYIVLEDGHYYMPPERATRVPDATLRQFAMIFHRASLVLLAFVKKVLALPPTRSS